jgi:hypothetical protein
MPVGEIGISNIEVTAGRRENFNFRSNLVPHGIGGFEITSPDVATVYTCALEKGRPFGPGVVSDEDWPGRIASLVSEDRNRQDLGSDW